MQCDFERPSQNKSDPALALNDRFAAIENTMAAILANMGGGANQQQNVQIQAPPPPRVSGMNSPFSTSLITPQPSSDQPTASHIDTYKPINHISMASNHNEVVTGDWRNGVLSNERKASFARSEPPTQLRSSLHQHYMIANDGSAVAGPSTYLDEMAAIAGSSGSSYPDLPPPRQNSNPSHFTVPDSGQGTTSASSMRDIQSLFDAGQLPSPSNSLPHSAPSNPFSDGARQLMPTGLSPASVARLNGTTESKISGPSPESRLKAAIAPSSRFSPPFKAITFNPRVWDNREQSRRASPEPGAEDGDVSAQLDGLRRSPSTPLRPRYGARDEPVKLGIITEATASMLFDQ
jgi:hypothetical protein